MDDRNSDSSKSATLTIMLQGGDCTVENIRYITTIVEHINEMHQRNAIK